MDDSALANIASGIPVLAKSAATAVRPPLWLQIAAKMSLAELIIGVIAVLVHPTPVSGAIFPLAIASIWLTGWAANACKESDCTRGS